MKEMLKNLAGDLPFWAVLCVPLLILALVWHLYHLRKEKSLIYASVWPVGAAAFCGLVMLAYNTVWEGRPWVRGVLASYLIVSGGMSLYTFIAFGLDKRIALLNLRSRATGEKQGSRIAEDDLHHLEIAGGWFGSLIAQQLFSHKTSKRSYQVVFWSTCIGHAGAVTGVVLLHNERFGLGIACIAIGITQCVLVYDKMSKQPRFFAYNTAGYDRFGYDINGYNRKGFGRDGFDEDGFDRNGLDADGWDEGGYNKDGYDSEGFDRHGRDRNQCDRDGDFRGIGANGYDQFGYDEWGYDKDGNHEDDCD